MTPARSSEIRSEPSQCSLTSTGRPPRLAARQPALGEGRPGGVVVFVEAHPGDTVAVWDGPIPRPVLGHEGVAPVLGRKHGAAVKVHTERGHMRPEPYRRHDHRHRRPAAAQEIRGRVAAAVIGETEVHPRAGGMVELVGGHVVAHVVGAVVREKELSSLGVEVSTAERICTGAAA